MKQTIHLTYFKYSGKYYTEETYDSEKIYLFDIIAEVRLLRESSALPGLTGQWPGYILISTNYATYGGQHLLT